MSAPVGAPAVQIAPVPGHTGWYEVCCGGGTYAVSLDGQCTCPFWEHRLSRTPGALCKHGEALAAYLDKQRECPVCDGRGLLVPRARYLDNRPLPCVGCGGSGLRERADG